MSYVYAVFGSLKVTFLSSDKALFSHFANIDQIVQVAHLRLLAPPLFEACIWETVCFRDAERPSSLSHKHKSYSQACYHLLCWLYCLHTRDGRREPIWASLHGRSQMSQQVSLGCWSIRMEARKSDPAVELIGKMQAQALLS